MKMKSAKSMTLKLKGLVTLIALAMLSAAPAPEEKVPELGPRSSLNDYLAYAAINNPGLESQWNSWKAAMQKVHQVDVLPDPLLKYGYYIQEVETRVGPQQQRFGLYQSFPWFGTLSSRGDAAYQMAMVEKARYEAKKQGLFYRVKHAYYDYWFLGRQIAVTEEHFQLMNSLEAVARARYKTGQASNTDLVKAQVELGKLEDRLIELRDRERVLAARLNAALGREPGAELNFPRRLDRTVIGMDETEMKEALAQRNPELVAIRHMAEAETAKIELSRKDYYPDFTLGVEYIQTGESDMDVDDNGKDPVIAAASVSLPIWRNKYDAAKEEAEFAYEAAVSGLGDRRNELLADLEAALFGLRDAERKIDLYENGLIPKASQALSVARKAFTAERAGFLDVIDAERTLLNFDLEYEKARADREREAARIDYLTGGAITGFSVDDNGGSENGN